MQIPKTIKGWIRPGVTCISLGFLLMGCAGANTAPLKQDLTRVDMAITEAEETNAGEHAPLELKLAREKLKKARTAFDRERYDKARFLVEEAMVDAKLAEAKARTAKTAQVVEELRQSIDTLNRELIEAKQKERSQTAQ